MSAPTFEALARGVLDSYTGAWWHPWENDRKREQRRELHHPSGWTTFAILVVHKLDDGSERACVQLNDVAFGRATPARRAAEQLREHLDWYLTRPVSPDFLTRWFWDAADRHSEDAAERLLEKYGHLLPESEGDPTFVDAAEGDALRALIFATQDEYRALAQ